MTGCTLRHENRLRRAGYVRIAGIDEAGRGPLAGPVVAAAVVLPQRFRHAVLTDSKKLSPSRRDRLYEELVGNPKVEWGLGVASVDEIDRINILRANDLAMRRAVEALELGVPDIALIDGLAVKDFPWEQEPLVKGDSLSLSIAAASIFAKVHRDRLMVALDAEFPAYGFAGHKGYGTAKHLAALAEFGPCPHHRMSFRPVREAAAD